MAQLLTDMTSSLPLDWAVTELGEAADLKNGSAFKPDDWKTKGVPIVRIQNLKDRNASFNYFQGNPNTKVPLKNGDLVFSWSGSIGTSFGPHHWWGNVAVLNQHIFRVDLKPKTNLTGPFLYFALLHLTKEIESHTYGLAALVHVRKGDLEATRVPVPPLPEQRKIALLLGLVQRAIEQQERLIALTTELKKSLMHRLFTEGLRGKRQKQTEIGPVPESWRVSRLDDFCVLQRGFDVTKTEQVAGNVPVVSSGGIASYHNVAKVKGPGVVVGRKGTLGKVHYVEVDYWPHDTTLWVKDFKENDRLFTSYFLKTLKFERFNSGASNPTLNRNTIHAELVAYPRKDEQAEIGRMLKNVEDKSRLHERKQTILKDLFRTLLHQLMTAQIRVHDLDLSFLEQEAVAS